MPSNQTNVGNAAAVLSLKSPPLLTPGSTAPSLGTRSISALIATVVPNLDYALQICSPSLTVGGYHFDQIQRLETQLINYFDDGPYDDRQWRLDLRLLNRQ